jgi:hypothetical protein
VKKIFYRIVGKALSVVLNELKEKEGGVGVRCPLDRLDVPF